MKQPSLVMIKPEGIARSLVGDVLNKFAEANLEMIAMRIVEAKQKIVEEHYRHIKEEPFFNGVVDHLLGRFHKQKKIILIIYYGENAIERCRKITGATNPQEADPQSIRGAFGRITAQGLFENIVHVSSDKREAEREIKLWFKPDDILIKLYSTQIKINKSHKKKEWL